MHYCCGSHRHGTYCPCCGAVLHRACPCCGQIQQWPLPRPIWNPPIYVSKPDVTIQVTFGRGTAAHATARLAGVS